jgi:hypothetical protein
MRFRCSPKPDVRPASATGMRHEKESRSRGSIQVLARDPLDKLDDALPQIYILYPRECLGEREPIACAEELGHIGGRRRLSIFLGLARQLRRTFEEERHRNLQYMGDVLQAARPHTVRSLLVFLHLLERNPEPVAELRLAHSEHHPTHSDPAAYVFVDRIGCLSDCLFHDTPELVMRVGTAQVAPSGVGRPGGCHKT